MLGLKLKAVITITSTSRSIKAAVPAKVIPQLAAETNHDIYPNMSDYQNSRIIRSYLARRNDPSSTQTSSGGHDYIPIIVMSVIVVVIVVALLFLA